MVGTVIEDTGLVLDAFRAALREQQIRVTEEELGVWRGASKREVLRAFVEREFGPGHPDTAPRIEQAYAAFREHLVQGYTQEGVRPMPGAEATFDWLHEHRIQSAVTTGFFRRVTDLILEALGWGPGAIQASVCSDEVAQGRPAPYMIFRAMEATGITDVRRVMKVGDTALDLLAGANAGAGGVVGVLSGSQTAEQLGCVEHAYLIPSVAELPGLLAGASGQGAGR